MVTTGATGGAQGGKPQAGSHPDMPDRSDRLPSLASAVAGRLRSERRPAGAGSD